MSSLCLIPQNLYYIQSIISKETPYRKGQVTADFRLKKELRNHNYVSVLALPKKAMIRKNKPPLLA